MFTIIISMLETLCMVMRKIKQNSITGFQYAFEKKIWKSGHVLQRILDEYVSARSSATSVRISPSFFKSTLDSFLTLYIQNPPENAKKCYLVNLEILCILAFEGKNAGARRAQQTHA